METRKHKLISYFLKYSSLSHGVLAITYAYSKLSDMVPLLSYNNISNIGNVITSVWDKEFGQFAYIIAHIIISINYILLSGISIDSNSNNEMEGNLKTQLLGVLGHSLLIIFSLWSFHYNSITSNMALFCLLQIGMIYFYISNNEPRRIISTIKIINRPLVNRDIYIIVFLSLSCFYGYTAFYTHELHRYGLWLLSSVYLILFIYWIRISSVKTKK